MADSVEIDPRPVKMCVCHQVSFAEIAVSQPKSLEDIAIQFGAGTGCQSCVAYLQRMIDTGETAFAVLPLDSV